MVSAFIYARVSSDEQSRGYSLDTQLDSMRKYCRDQDYQIIGEYTDVHSGTDPDRPGINQLIEEAGEKRPDAVVLYDVDRLGRELIVQAVLDQEISRTGAEVEYVLGGKDELLRMIKGALAVYENRQRVERSRRGKNGRAKAGHPMVPGKRAPFGYTYISRPHSGELVINEEEAAVYRQMVRWLLVDRFSSYEIARRLFDADILSRGDKHPGVVIKKTGKGEWSPTTVRKMLANPLYKGDWYWGKTRMVKRGGVSKQERVPESEWIHVSVPAIIDATTWDQVQETLKQNRVNSKRNTRREYLLRSLVFCVCGRRWTGRYHSTSGNMYYRCPSNDREHWRAGCPTDFSIRCDRLEPAVWNYVTEFLSDPAVMIAEIQNRRNQQAADAQRRQQRIDAVEMSLAKVTGQLSELLTMELEGYPAAVINQHKKSLIEQHGDLETELARMRRESSDQDITPELENELKAIAENVAVAMPAMTFEERRRVLDMLRIRIDVIDKDNVKVSGFVSVGFIALSHSRKDYKRPLDLSFERVVRVA